MYGLHSLKGFTYLGNKIDRGTYSYGIPFRLLSFVPLITTKVKFIKVVNFSNLKSRLRLLKIANFESFA